MATLTVECNLGPASVEASADESTEQVAARLAEAIGKAGGRKGERAEKPHPPTRGEQMASRELLECARCRAWVKPTRLAAERHRAKCPARATAHC